MLHSVDFNPWFMGALRLAAQWTIPGWAWLWCIPELDGVRSHWRHVLWTSWALVIGVPVSLVTALYLGTVGHLSPLVHYGVLGGISLLGALWGYMRARPVFLGRLCAAIPGVGVCFLMFIGIMLLPNRSEWVLGGWDPGVYINQGYAVGSNGSLGPYDLAGYEQLSEESFELFRYGSAQYQQIMPGIPVDVEVRQQHVYFFRMMPTLVAVTAQAGGLRAATRVNIFVGFMVLPVFFSMVLAYGTRTHALFALLGLALQPLWVYHLQIPTTEMLQLFCLCAVGLLFSVRMRGVAPVLHMALLFFVMTVNRADFLLVGILFLCMSACLDLDRTPRRNVWIAHAIPLCGLAVAAWYNEIASPLTLIRIRRFIDAIEHWSLIGAGALCVALVLGRFPRARHALLLVWCRVRLPFVLMVCALLVGIQLVPAPLSLEGYVLSAKRLVPYLGYLPVCLAIIASPPFFAGGKNELLAPLRGVLAVLALVCLASMVDGRIAGIYPYATRRFFPYAVPVVVVLSSFILSRMWNSVRWPYVGRAGALMLFAFWFVFAVKPAGQAWTRAEYVGISAAIAEVAEQVDDRDMVIVDHPWWGTPLLFIHGKAVINGLLIWNADNEETMIRAMHALDRLRSYGWRIRFLTSTQDALDIYSVNVKGTEQDWAGDVVKMHEIHHHRYNKDFPIRERAVQFRLFTWFGEPPAEKEVQP